MSLTHQVIPHMRLCMARSPFIVVNTDLDATLLDHDTYDWSPAQPALQALRARGVPVILNSSKTLGEMQALASELQLQHPMVCENGALIAFPREGAVPLAVIRQAVGADGSVEEHGAYWLCYLGTSRADLLPIVHKLRGQYEQYSFRGYADWTVEEVANHTGLPLAQAALSHQRDGTEPIHWHGTEGAYTSFVTALAEHQIQAVVGGRFIHLSGESDKGRGLKVLHKVYGMLYPDCDVCSVALGDSPNDLAMLNAADVAIVIPNHTPLSPTAPHTIHASAHGPTGWNVEILKLLQIM